MSKRRQGGSRISAYLHGAGVEVEFERQPVSPWRKSEFSKTCVPMVIATAGRQSLSCLDLDRTVTKNHRFLNFCQPVSTSGIFASTNQSNGTLFKQKGGTIF